MMEAWAIPTGLIDVGPWGLLVGVVAFIFYGVVKGWLVPKSQHDAMVASAIARAVAAEAANERLSERAAKLTETNNIQARAIDAQASVGDTVTKLVNAIQDARTMAGGSA